MIALMLSAQLANATVNTTMTWNPSSDPGVTGYNIYFGTQSHNYTNMVSVGNVTNATIGNLTPGITYYFAAKARDNAGDQSDFSNEASFTGYLVNPSGSINLQTMPSGLTNDLVTFSLAAGAPSAAWINPTNGVLVWTPSFADAGTVKNITVIVTDLTHPTASTQETLSVIISDYLDCSLPSVPVQAGKTASLPITLISSAALTNLTFNVNWPGTLLRHTTLIFNPPLTGGTLINQGTNLVVQLFTTNGESLIGTNLIGQLYFQATPGQSSAFIGLPISTIDATKATGATFSYVVGEAGEAVVIGTNPLLRPHADQGQGRSLTLYANPGNNYQLQQNTEYLAPNSWHSIRDYQPTNMMQTVTLDSANPTVFYRLMNE